MCRNCLCREAYAENGKKDMISFMKKMFRVCGLLLFMLILLTACGKEELPEGGKVYNIHYVNKEETRTLTREYVSDTEDTKELLLELLEQLATIPAKLEYEAPLSNGFALLGYTLENGQLTMNFDEHYKEMDITKEVLVRAAMVRTVTQIPGVDYVSFTVQGEMLADSSGNAIGTMSADTFIDNAGNEINAYEKVNLRLYFANEDGTKDGICYVNLNEEFANQPYNVRADVTIYSITNSLVELPNVNKVQILINGETGVYYRDKVYLSDVFERNLDLLTVKEE